MKVLEAGGELVEVYDVAGVETCASCSPEALVCDQRAAMSRGWQLASALAALHAQGLVHGAIDAAHVAVSGEVVTLLPSASSTVVDPAGGEDSLRAAQAADVVAVGKLVARPIQGRAYGGAPPTRERAVLGSVGRVCGRAAGAVPARATESAALLAAALATLAPQVAASSWGPRRRRPPCLRLCSTRSSTRASQPLDRGRRGAPTRHWVSGRRALRHAARARAAPRGAGVPRERADWFVRGRPRGYARRASSPPSGNEIRAQKFESYGGLLGRALTAVIAAMIRGQSD